MTSYQIFDVNFELKSNEVVGDGFQQSINDKTKRTIILFLNADKATISKDELVASVWQGVIVSDASVFKQIQVVRNIFEGLGLPKDLIENVYGKGYRLRLPVKSMAVSQTQIKTKKSWGLTIPLFVMVAVLLVVGIQTKPEKALLSQEDKRNILNLSKNNWQDGLENIKTLLASEKAYTDTDRAFLYHQHGQAASNVQQFDLAKTSLHRAKKLYSELKEWKSLGDVSLEMARLYAHFDDKNTQGDHIDDAINFYEKAGAKTQVIDALLEKADYQKQNKAYDAAIQTYNDVIKTAKDYGDQVGQTMAINNLAATHKVLNQNDKAILLAEQGLKLSMDSGNGQHIANSYSFLSQLYWQQGSQKQALDVMSQSLAYQVETENYRHLSPKLMNMNYLLIETGQFKTADRLLAVTEDYAQALNVKGGSAVIALYQGMNAAHQQQWPEAKSHLELAYQRALEHNFPYKKPATMAYLSVARAQTGNNLKAIEMARLTLQEKQASDREKLLANLALVRSYMAMEQLTLATETLASLSSFSDWPFGQISVAQVKMNLLPETAIEERLRLQGEIDQAKTAWQKLADDSAFDTDLLDKVLSQVEQLVMSLHDKKIASNPMAKGAN